MPLVRTRIARETAPSLRHALVVDMPTKLMRTIYSCLVHFIYRGRSDRSRGLRATTFVDVRCFTSLCVFLITYCSAPVQKSALPPILAGLAQTSIDARAHQHIYHCTKCSTTEDQRCPDSLFSESFDFKLADLNVKHSVGDSELDRSPMQLNV